MSEPAEQPIHSIPPAAPPDGPPDTLTRSPTQSANPARPADPGAAVPGYELVCELGRGGMGVVYEARQAKLNRTVALKMVLAGGDVARFLAEAEAVAAVRHPHVVQVYDFGHLGGRPYMALEYLPGGSLSDKVRRGGPLAPRAAADLVEKLARGVQAAHDLGIVHRDLKPANVLFDETGEPKVTDFGLAKRGTGSDLTQTNAVMGTPAYMAPEQAAGRTKFVGPAADTYALGAILFECLTGRPPFQDTDTISLLLKVARDDPPPATKFAPGVPRDLDLICRKCLAKEPHDRYSSAAAFADDLRRWRAGETITARPAGVVERAWKWARRHRAAALAVASVLAALVAGTVVSTWQAVRATEAERETAKQLALTQKAEADARAAGEAAKDEARKAVAAEAVATGALAAARRAEETAKDEAAKARAAEGAAKRAEGTAKDEAARARAAEATAKAAEAAAKAAEELARDRERQEAAARAEAERQRAAADGVAKFLRAVLAQADPEQLAWEGQPADPNRTVRAAVDYTAQLVGKSLATDPEVEAAVRHTLGVVYLRLGDRGTAEAQYARALDLRRRHLGPAAPDTLDTLTHLGAADLRFGRFDQAEKRLREAYDGLGRLGERDPRFLAAAQSLAELYWTTDRPDKAEPVARQVAVGYAIAYGGWDPFTAAALNQLALVYQDLGRPADGEPLLRRAAAAYWAAYGPGDLKTARVLTNLGVCLLAQDRPAEAEGPLAAGWRVRQRRDPDGWGTWNAQGLLGRALLAQGKYAEAEPRLVGGFEGLKARAGQVPPARRGRVAEAARHVAWLYDRWGKPAEAARWRAEHRADMAVEPAPPPRPVN